MPSFTARVMKDLPVYAEPSFKWMDNEKSRQGNPCHRQGPCGIINRNAASEKTVGAKWRARQI